MSQRPDYPLPTDDADRLRTLHDLKVLDTAPEERFEGLIQELAETLDAPIAYLSLIDAERQWLKAKVGPIAREVGREQAFCSQVITDTGPVVVEDASEDLRFAPSILTTDEPGVRFYAGVPIADQATGHTLGTVCIADRKSRQLTSRELAILEGFAERLAKHRLRSGGPGLAASVRGSRRGSHPGEAARPVERPPGRLRWRS